THWNLHRCSGQGAGAESEESRRIDLRSRPEMHDGCTDIVRRHQPVGSDLFLKAEVPLLRVRGLRMQRHRFITAECHERAFFRQSTRKWIATRESLPRVRKRRWVRNGYVVAERWTLRKSDVVVQ